MRANYFTNTFSIVSYVSAAMSFVGYPLAFYVHYKYMLPLYANVGAILVFLPVFMIAALIPGFAVNAYIDDCKIVIEKYTLKTLWQIRARQQYLFSDIQRIELLRSNDKFFHNIYFCNKHYLSVSDVQSSFIDNIHKCYGKEILELPTHEAKEKRTIALVFGVIILDIVLIFVAIYLAT